MMNQENNHPGKKPLAVLWVIIKLSINTRCLQTDGSGSIRIAIMMGKTIRVVLMTSRITAMMFWVVWG